jgi:hypothetical protein
MFNPKINLMKKVFLLFALVAFLVASSVPVYAVANTNSIAIAQMNDDDPKKDKKTEEKSDKKSDAKSDPKCSEAKSADCCSKSKEACDTKKAEDKGKK